MNNIPGNALAAWFDHLFHVRPRRRRCGERTSPWTLGSLLLVFYPLGISINIVAFWVIESAAMVDNSIAVIDTLLIARQGGRG